MFCRSWGYFCALNAVTTRYPFPWRRTSFCSLIHMGKIRKIIQDDNHFLIIFIPPPRFPRGGHVFIHNFCIYFWKGWRGTWTIQWGVRHTTLSYPLLYPVHSTYYMTISVWWWSSLIIDVPHVDFQSTHVMISLLMIIDDFRFDDDRHWQCSFALFIRLI